MPKALSPKGLDSTIPFGDTVDFRLMLSDMTSLPIGIAFTLLLLGAPAGASGAKANSATSKAAPNAIVLQKQVLNVSATWIDNQLDFANQSGLDVEQAMVYSLPAYLSHLGSTARLVEPGYDPEQPRGIRFAVEVDGKSVAFTRSVDAFFKGKSITAQLLRLGLNEDQIAYGSVEHFGAVKQLSAGQVQKLVALGLMTGQPDERNGAYWSVKVSYSWQQKFPAHKMVHIRHQFVPNFVRGGDDVPELPGFAEKYCADKDFINGWKNLRTRSAKPVNAFFVSHQLTGSRKHAIEDFTLNLHKNFPDDVVTLCFPGHAKKIGNMQYQFQLKNFQPRQDLHVYFGAGERERGPG